MQYHFEWLWKLDPDQLKGLKLLQSEHHALLSVTQAEKQNELIVAWALEALLKGKKGYIVLGNPAQRESVYRVFEEMDLASIVYLKNKTQYFPSLQLARKKQADPKEMKSHQFAMATAQQEMRRWQSRYDLLESSVFDVLTWRDLADRLAAHPLSGKPNILQLKLNPTEFERSAEEYKMIRSKLSNYIKLCKLNHPWFDQLSELNIDHLRQYALETIKKEVSKHLSEVTVLGEEIIRSGEVLLLDFIQHAKQSLQAMLKGGYQKIAALLFKIENYQHFLGEEFALETSFSNFTLKLKSNFARSSKDLIEARRLVKSSYMELLTDLDTLETYLPPASLQPVEMLSMKAIETHLHALSNDLTDCERKMQARINEQIKRLNSKNLQNGHPLHGRIKDWEEELSAWKKQIDTSPFLNIQYEVNALSVRKKLNLVTDIVRQLREMRRACAKLEDFFFWRTFEDNIPESARKVIAALEFEEHHRWLDLFDQWYFLSTLEQHTLAEMPESTDAEEMPEKIAASARRSIVQYLKANTQDKRHAFLASKDPSARKIQRLIRKRDEKSTQYELEQLDPEKRFELFPIQFINPEHFTRLFGVSYQNPAHEVLYVMHEEDIEIGTQLASTSRITPCHILGDPGVAKRLLQTSQSARKIQFRLKSVRSGDLVRIVPLKEISSSEKLSIYKQVASLFEPVYDQMVIYTTKYLQVVSFLGPRLDEWFLNEMSTPYKIHDEGMHPTSGFLVECLLDHKKPIIVLIRDGLFSAGDPEAILWQNHLSKRCNQIGIPVYASWTVDWMTQGKKQMEMMKDFLYQFIPVNVQEEKSKSA